MPPWYPFICAGRFLCRASQELLLQNYLPDPVVVERLASRGFPPESAGGNISIKFQPFALGADSHKVSIGTFITPASGLVILSSLVYIEISSLRDADGTSTAADAGLRGRSSW